MHIWRSDRLNFRSFPTAKPKSFIKPVIQFSLKTVFKKGEICLKGLELFQDQISVRRICEPNLCGWCIICATHLRSMYIWAASLDDSSRCRHNLFILIFACMFCEKGKRIREASREKCISSWKYVVYSFLCVKHPRPSSTQLHKAKVYGSTA